MALYWLSFADATLPRGTQFLGACIVEGGSTGDEIADSKVAIQRAWDLGCNPGGEVMFLQIPDTMTIAAGWRDRLLTRVECEAFDRERGG